MGIFASLKTVNINLTNLVLSIVGFKLVTGVAIIARWSYTEKLQLFL